MIKKCLNYFLIITCLVELLLIALLYNDRLKSNVFYNEGDKEFFITNEDNEEIIYVKLSEDNIINEIVIDDKRRYRIKFSNLGGDKENIYFYDNKMPFQSLQQLNLTEEILLDRQEYIKFYQRHYQIFNDGSIQQRKADLNNKDWILEMPVKNQWIDVFNKDKTHK